MRCAHDLWFGASAIGATGGIMQRALGATGAKDGSSALGATGGFM